MTKEEIFEKVKKILVKNIQDYRKEVDDDITLDSSIDYDLGADSLDTFYIRHRTEVANQIIEDFKKFMDE